MKNKLEILKEKKSQISNLKNDVIELSSDIFENFNKYIFEKYPKLKSFGWCQYTPYFNDGDTCTFSADTNYISINDERVDEADWLSPVIIKKYGNWNRDTKKYEGREEEPNPKFDEEMSKAVDEIRDFLSHFDDDFFLNQFGDHAEVVVTKEGVNINDYDHD